jgi:prepilin-type processing-associated H-X9-DG protein
MIVRTGKITPFLWFDGHAEEAARFYVSLFKNSKLTNVSRLGEPGPPGPGRATLVSFELEGQPLVALNGGPTYRLTPAFSLYVGCESQDEVDHYWGRLADGGKEMQCGWVEDRFGLSWQIVPNALLKLLGDSDKAKAARVMQAMLRMKKLVIADLERAAAG